MSSWLFSKRPAWLPVWSPLKWFLVFANIFAAGLLIVLDNIGVVPFDGVHFLFFLFVTLLFALYRPGWTFLLLVGFLPLEAVNLAPEGLGVNLRPYQWASVVLILALAVRMFMKRITFPLFTPRWFDGALFLVPFGAFLSAWTAPDAGFAFKQAVIVSSFFLLYLLFRQYLQSLDDIRQTLPFFFGSALVVLGYTLWQSVREEAGLEAFTIMAGRPNGTFPEADWLGMFVLFLLSALWAVGARKGELLETLEKFEIKKYIFAGPWPTLFFAFHTLAVLVLIITVSRSAWLGALLAALLSAVLLLTTPGHSPVQVRTRRALFFLVFLFSSLVVALGTAWVFKLTSFNLVDRAASTVTGFQKITVACEQSVPLSEQVYDPQALAALGCRHILLEEKEDLARAGLVIGEVHRRDPNIEERRNIYRTAKQIIRENVFLGIGWGSIGSFLGTDERGARFNASNIFLETWLGSGLAGLGGLVVFLGALLLRPLPALWRGKGERSALLFSVIAAFGLTVFNFFNSGILLGFFFLFLAIGGSALIVKKAEPPKKE